MAKQAPAAPKMRWYKTLWHAYKATARTDKPLPWILGGLLLGPIAMGVILGIVLDGIAPKIYGPLFGVTVGAMLALYVLTRRFERTMYAQMDGVLGGSLAVAQTIRSGWQFADEPLAVDAKSHAVVFQGVGKGGIVLLAEGGRAAKRTVDQTTQRLHKLAPGVPVSAVYVGHGEGEVTLRDVPKAVKATRAKHFGRGIGKGLSSADQATVRSRLRALGGPQMPIPKGVDPTKARADRKGLRGR